MKDVLLIGLLTVSFAAVPRTVQSAPAIELLNSKRPLVIAHRGYCQFAPENSLPAFELAAAAGADLIELDYHHSKDNQMVVIHDAELDRTTDATNKWGKTRIRVDATPAADIRTLDGGSWFDPKFKGVKIPSLHEALATIQRSNVTLIERKAGPAKDCAELLRQQQLINQVVVQAFDWEYLRLFHEQQPEQVLGALGPPNKLPDGTKPSGMAKELNAAWLDLLPPTGAKIAVWSQNVSKEAVAEAHRRGLKVWVYTINDPELAQRLLDMGVDGIITNNVSLIWRAVALWRGKSA